MKSRKGIGSDIIEIKRFEDKPLEKNKKFYNSIFSKSELIHSKKYSDPYPHIAGIFAAKEAVLKCIDEPLHMLDIQIKWNKNGKPIVVIPKTEVEINVTISHTNQLAIAVAATLT